MIAAFEAFILSPRGEKEVMATSPANLSPISSMVKSLTCTEMVWSFFSIFSTATAKVTGGIFSVFEFNTSFPPRIMISLIIPTGMAAVVSGCEGDAGDVEPGSFFSIPDSGVLSERINGLSTTAFLMTISPLSSASKSGYRTSEGIVILCLPFWICT